MGACTDSLDADGTLRLIVAELPKRIDVTLPDPRGRKVYSARAHSFEERGECHTVAMDCFGNPPFNQSGLHGNSTACGCSECGAPWSTCSLFRGNALGHNFKACPICGRRVVEE